MRRQRNWPRKARNEILIACSEGGVTRRPFIMVFAELAPPKPDDLLWCVLTIPLPCIADLWPYRRAAGRIESEADRNCLQI